MGYVGAARTGVRIQSAHYLVTSKFSSLWVHLRIRFGAGKISVRDGKIFTFSRKGEAESGFSVSVQRNIWH